MLDESATKWLEGRGLDTEIAVRLGVSSERQSGDDWLVFPIVVGGKTVNHKYRCIPDKKFRQDKGGEKYPFNYDCLLDHSLDHLPLVITEGELDALACIQAGYPRTISAPDGAPATEVEDTSLKLQWLDHVARILDRDAEARADEIIIATDNDAPGWNLRDGCMRKLGSSRCKWLDYPASCKDPNDILLKLGEAQLMEYLRDAPWWPVAGVFSFDQLPPEPQRAIYSTGITDLDPHWKIRKGELAVITGIPGHGKTTLVNDIAFSCAKRHGWRIGYGSFEQPPRRALVREAHRWLHERPPDKITDDQARATEQFLRDHFVFFLEDLTEDEAMDVNWMIRGMQAAVTRFEADMIVIDPWNELDHEWPWEENETIYTGKALKKLRRMADFLGVALIIVAHPRKVPIDKNGKPQIPSLYDISGSSNWANKPDVGVVVHQEKGVTKVTVRKVRFQEDIGRPGDVDLMYNTLTGKFSAAADPDELI